jgi:hypothetical protein
MTTDEWKKICDSVSEKMRAHTRPFISPLSAETETDIRLLGTGTYICHEGRRLLFTCNHVVAEPPIHYGFYNSSGVYEYKGQWTKDTTSDIAYAEIKHQLWYSSCHLGKVVPFSRFAARHEPISDELLFFHGYAGENSTYGFGRLNNNGTGYCTQEKKNTADEKIFELLWQPNDTKLASSSNAVGKSMKFQNPGGFSGALVWNTRYVEFNSLSKEWSPEEAVVTGLLQRWDQKKQALLALRVEQLQDWLKDRAS